MSKKYNNLKILSFVPYYPPHLGGLEKYAYDLHEKFSREGNEITVFTSDVGQNGKGETKKGVEIICYPAWEIIFGYPVPKVWSKKFWVVVKRLYKRDYDVVFSSTRFFLSSLMALFFAKRKKTAWLHIEHGSDFVKSDSRLIVGIARVYDETLGRLVLRMSNANIAPSLSAQRFIGKFDRREVPVIYRGVNAREIAKINPDQQTRKRFGGRTIITFAGRLIKTKGVLDLIGSLPKLKHDNYVVLIAGEGPLKHEVDMMIKKLELDERVYLLGQKTREQMIGLLKNTDIFVNPSYSEGLPTALLEASLCECAIVATDIGGTNEIVRDRHSALLYKPGKSAELIKCLDKLLESEEKRIKLAKAAYFEVVNKFDWSKTYQGYIDVINEVTRAR